MYKLCSFIIISCISSFLVYNFSNSNKKELNNNYIKDNIEVIKFDNILEEKQEIIIDIPKEEKELLTIDIPKINFSGKVYNKNSELNNIDKNIVIMNESSMPDEDGGIVIIGGHSGYGKYAYFKELNKLDIDDQIIIHYLDHDYIYKVVNYYLDFKDGSIRINNVNKKNKLFLYTCNPNDKNNYLVFDCELI